MPVGSGLVGAHNAQLTELLRSDFLTRDEWQQLTVLNSLTINQGGAVACVPVIQRYVVLADTVILCAKLRVSPFGAGAAGAAVGIGNIPAALSGANFGLYTIVGSGLFYVASTGQLYAVSVEMLTATQLNFYGYNVTGRWGIDPNIGLASGDYISFTITYER